MLVRARATAARAREKETLALAKADLVKCLSVIAKASEDKRLMAF
jgi:hypothetical protein